MVYYGVRGGPRPGVYTTWDEASKCSQGHRGALCKKFPDQASALAFAGPGASAVPAQSQAACDSKSISVANGMTASRSGPSLGSVPSTVSAQSQADTHSGRTYLEVPFGQKDEAKALGAKWHPERKKWFAESAHDLPALLRWLPGAQEHNPDSAPSVPAKKKKDRKPAVSELFLPSADRKALAAPQPDELALYTDGACKGNNHVASKTCPAGWGVAVVGGGGADGSHATGTGRLVAELFGPVVLDSASPFFLGAEIGSNNTSELSGICEALFWLLHHEPSSRSAAIFYDSKYAAKITTGEYRAEKNKCLAEKSRSLLQSVRQKRRVRFEHVKGHSNDRWNDAADGLANRGAAGQACSIGRYGPGDGAPPAKRARLGAA